MELGPFDTEAGPDRFATNDEIRTALSLLTDSFIACEKDNLWEVASDLGGRVLVEIEKEEDGALIFLEGLDAITN